MVVLCPARRPLFIMHIMVVFMHILHHTQTSPHHTHTPQHPAQQTYRPSTPLPRLPRTTDINSVLAAALYCTNEFVYIPKIVYANQKTESNDSDLLNFFIFDFSEWKTVTASPDDYNSVVYFNFNWYWMYFDETK